jgi:hypothetical protein
MQENVIEFPGAVKHESRRHLLAARPGNLAVLPVTNVRWNDLGKPDRVLSTIGGLMPPLAFEQVSNSLALSATAEARA